MKRFFQENTPPAPVKTTQAALLFVAIALLVALLAYLLWPTATAVSPSQPPNAAGWQESGVANPFGQTRALAQPAFPSALPAAAFASAPASSALLAHTSLAGTQPDGTWEADALGQLKTSLALRQRFDYYLSLMGEMPIANIRALVGQAAQLSLKDPALNQALAMFDRYVQLQQHSWKHVVDLREPNTWSAALTERQIVRREMLGAEVAQAFYAEEERQLQDMLARLHSGQNNTAEPEKVTHSPIHPQASEREAQLQVQWQQWDQRIATARSQIQAYTQAPELSAPQRQQVIEQYLARQFEGTERVRARSLLGL